jgi:mannan endo-1,4-beta-mannosidase
VPFQPTASGTAVAGGTYAQFVRAWRYVVTFFRAHGATNVRWVFNPTTDTYAETTPVARIWPGARYVDVLGLDGYNWGTGGVLRWRSFADIYRTQYQRLIALAPSLPVWVCEFGSKAASENDGADADPRHSNSVWLSGMFSWLGGATHVRALVMFNVRKERDWRIQASPTALQVMRSEARTSAPRVAA